MDERADMQVAQYLVVLNHSAGCFETPKSVCFNDARAARCETARWCYCDTAREGRSVLIAFTRADDRRKAVMWVFYGFMRMCRILRRSTGSIRQF